MIYTVKSHVVFDFTVKSHVVFDLHCLLRFSILLILSADTHHLIYIIIRSYKIVPVGLNIEKGKILALSQELR